MAHLTPQRFHDSCLLENGEGREERRERERERERWRRREARGGEEERTEGRMEGPWEWRDECEGKLGGKGDLGDKHAREMQGRVKESVEKGRGERERYGARE